MSDNKPIVDAPATDKAAKRAERAKREADDDAARHAADDAEDTADDAAAAHPAGIITDVRPVVPGSDIGPVDATQTESIAAANAAMNAGQRGQPPGAPAGEAAPAVDRDPGNPDPNARVEPAPDHDADDAAKRQAEAAAKAEEAKADRAKRGVTGAENGDPAGVAFGARIEAARFEHRNQGHTDTLQLLDDMLLALQRLEGKAAGQ